MKKEDLKKVLEEDKPLKRICELIDKKIFILDFQHKAIDIEKDKLSYLLQQVIDENKMIKIMPKTLDGFFKICFIIDNLDKSPENANLWLVYLLSYVNQKLNSYELFQLMYSLDFLYPKIELKNNEFDLLIEKINEISKKINDFSKKDGSYQSDKKIAPLEDTRYSLFVVNILEDLIQDILYYYDNKINLKPITTIYQSVFDINKTYDFVQDASIVAGVVHQE